MNFFLNITNYLNKYLLHDKKLHFNAVFHKFLKRSLKVRILLTGYTNMIWLSLMRNVVKLLKTHTYIVVCEEVQPQR